MLIIQNPRPRSFQCFQLMFVIVSMIQHWWTKISTQDVDMPCLKPTWPSHPADIDYDYTSSLFGDTPVSLVGGPGDRKYPLPETSRKLRQILTISDHEGCAYKYVPVLPKRKMYLKFDIRDKSCCVIHSYIHELRTDLLGDIRVLASVLRYRASQKQHGL